MSRRDRVEVANLSAAPPRSCHWSQIRTLNMPSRPALTAVPTVT